MDTSSCISTAIGVEYAYPEPVEGVLLCLKSRSHPWFRYDLKVYSTGGYSLGLHPSLYSHNIEKILLGIV